MNIPMPTPQPTGAQAPPEFQPQRTTDPVPTNDYQIYNDIQTREYDQSRCYKKGDSK